MDDWKVNIIAINIGAKSVTYNKDKKEYTFYLSGENKIVMTLKEVQKWK